MRDDEMMLFALETLKQKSGRFSGPLSSLWVHIYKKNPPRVKVLILNPNLRVYLKNIQTQDIKDFLQEGKKKSPKSKVRL